MKQLVLGCLSIATIMSFVGSLLAEESPATTVPTIVKGTFLITGLHCPPCTTTVEKSVKSIKAVSVFGNWLLVDQFGFD